jgi:hypothetical protein
MGFDFTQGASKAEIVKMILTTTGEYTPVVSKVVAGGFWVVWDHVTGDRNARFIGLYLLEKQKGFGWGYNSMTEAMGPSDVSCPLPFLEITPLPASPYAANWREKVKAHWAAKAKRGEQAALGEAREREAETPACLAHFSAMPCPICALENAGR